MSPDTINAIKSALAPIAEKIGQGAEYGWGVVVKQQYIEGITDFIVAGLCLAGVIFFFVAGSKLKKTADWKYGDGTAFASAICFFLAMILFAAPFSINIIDGAQHMLNPDYYALDFFIHLGDKTSSK